MEFGNKPIQEVTDTFISNLKNVFDYQATEIPKIFNNRKVPQIKTLRNKLLVRVATDFPEFKNRVPLPHTYKNDLVNDIIILGQALARPNVSNELESVFIPVIPDKSEVSTSPALEKLEL